MKKFKGLFILLPLILLGSCSTSSLGGSETSKNDENSQKTPQNPNEISENEKIDEPLNKENLSKNTYYQLGKNTFSRTYFAPSKGDLNILVVPLIIKGYESNATKENLDKINEAFFGKSATNGVYESVSSFFKKSSFGALNIGGEVTSWVDIEMSVDDVNEAQHGQGDYGTYEVLTKVYAYLKSSSVDLNKYDLDKDGYIDCIYLVHSAPTNASSSKLASSDPNNPFISFTYWDYRQYNESSIPVPNSYSWASFDLMNYGKSAGIEIDAHTYIHEVGHVLGLVDYYDYDGLHSPLGCFDMQDFNVGDHNSYSKYALGWTSPYYINKDATIKLKSTSDTGEFIVIKNSPTYSGNAFDEYIILEYLTPTSLWSQDSTNAYPNINTKTFTKPGVRMLHVDARLIDANGKFVDEISQTKVRQAFSNTPSRSLVNIKNQSQHKFDLISIINANGSKATQTKALTTASNSSLFTEGQVFKSGDYSFFFNDGGLHSEETFPFKITFGKMDESGATLTIKKID